MSETMNEFRLFDFRFADKKEFIKETIEEEYGDYSTTSISNSFEIQLFGINELGESVMINIDDFKNNEKI